MNQSPINISVSLCFCLRLVDLQIHELPLRDHLRSNNRSTKISLPLFLDFKFHLANSFFILRRTCRDGDGICNEVDGVIEAVCGKGVIMVHCVGAEVVT